MMIEAVIYGLIPTATTEKLARVPPAKTLSKLKNWLSANNCLRAATLTPGTGIWANSLKIKKIVAVKSNFFRSSRLFKTARILFSVFFNTNFLFYRPTQLFDSLTCLGRNSNTFYSSLFSQSAGLYDLSFFKALLDYFM